MKITVVVRRLRQTTIKLTRVGSQ